MHDVYLIPFEKATLFQPVLNRIRAVVPNGGGVDGRVGVDMGIDLSELLVNSKRFGERRTTEC